MSTYNVSAMYWHWEGRAILLYPYLFMIWKTCNGYYYSGLGMTWTRDQAVYLKQRAQTQTNLQGDSPAEACCYLCSSLLSMIRGSYSLCTPALYHVFFLPVSLHWCQLQSYSSVVSSGPGLTSTLCPFIDCLASPLPSPPDLYNWGHLASKLQRLSCP